jgi:hypothetical protein
MDKCPRIYNRRGRGKVVARVTGAVVGRGRIMQYKTALRALTAPIFRRIDSQRALNSQRIIQAPTNRARRQHGKAQRGKLSEVMRKLAEWE